MQVLIFSELGLKTPIHAPKIAVLTEKVDQSSSESLNVCYVLMALIMPNSIAFGQTL